MNKMKNPFLLLAWLAAVLFLLSNLSCKDADNEEETVAIKTESKSYTVHGVTFNMQFVQGGTFTIGATPEQGTDDPTSDEYPTHRVTLSDYYIGETEVTQDLWAAVMRDGSPSPPRAFEAGGDGEFQRVLGVYNQAKPGHRL